jgi:hypothetical protein
VLNGIVRLTDLTEIGDKVKDFEHVKREHFSNKSVLKGNFKNKDINSRFTRRNIDSGISA